MPERDLGAVEKALHLLDCFGQGEPAHGLAEIAKLSGLSKATCHRTLQALYKYGLLEREGEVYRLGYRLLELAAHVKNSIGPLTVGLDLMERLRDEVDQSVQLVVRSGDEVVYAEVLPPYTPSRLYIRPGRRAPLYAGASGRLLLASMPDNPAQAILGRAELRKFTSRTPQSIAQILAGIAATRQTWCTRSLGELERYSAELAAPVLGAGGATLATLSLAGAEKDYVQGERLKSLLLALDATAMGISRRLGYDDAWPTRPESFLEVCRVQDLESRDAGPQAEGGEMDPVAAQ